MIAQHGKDQAGSSDDSLFTERYLLSTRPVIRALAVSTLCMPLAKKLLGSKARAVKATLFNKNAKSNWIVPPHQDVTIAVEKRIDIKGFGPWTEKCGVVNVQPPVSILQQMLAFRVHLDDCDAENGALKVWPGSHGYGRLRDDGIANWIQNHDPEIFPVPRGGCMIMRPLLIHASSKAINPSNRRVVHIEYAVTNLPGGLRWLDELA